MYYLKKHETSMVNRYYKLIDSTYNDDLRPKLLVNEKDKARKKKLWMKIN